MSPPLRLFATVAAWSLVASGALPAPVTAQHTHDGPSAVLRPPASVQAEHEAIHATLVEATRLAGDVGTAARALAAVLHPHFVREEEIALPPLALLEPLARGEQPPRRDEVLKMTTALRAELPRMLEEHAHIKAAVERLRLAATAANADVQVRLAEQLALHAQMEEQVFYPAAILVGDALRARPPGH